VFNNDDLHHIRTDELDFLAGLLKPASSVLELGAGTGFQARGLASRGFDVKAIDLPDSSYSTSRVFPVIDYDGRTIPFPDASFDVVFSSNVLEHVPDLRLTLSEVRRVLKPGGYAVHARPSPTWRFWTTVAGPLDCVPFLVATVMNRVPKQSGKRNLTPVVAFVRGIAGRFAPLAHGETGNALTELITFGKRYWIKKFEANGFVVMSARPMNLFYTGWCVLGQRLPIDRRRRIAKTLGSACYVYEIRPI
jgi:SAM-dependent methyltransferase